MPTADQMALIRNRRLRSSCLIACWRAVSGSVSAGWSWMMCGIVTPSFIPGVAPHSL